MESNSCAIQRISFKFGSLKHKMKQQSIIVYELVCIVTIMQILLQHFDKNHCLPWLHVTDHCSMDLISDSFKASTQSPINITAFKLNSTSLRVTWTKISADQVGGVIIGYMVVFHVVNDGNSSMKSVVQCGFMNQTILGNLQIFTNYSIRILGFTRTGKLGSVSDPVYAMTDEDGR